MRFWMSYTRSNKLDVQETNSCFSQFNRIRNDILGRRIEVGRVACSGTMGSNCFCSWKQNSGPMVAGIPSNLNPASKEMISNSVEL